jgi:hypothetical protein
MKKLLFLIALVSISWCSALFGNAMPKNLLSIVKAASSNPTPEGITAILGHPIKTEESRRKTTFYFDGGSVNVVMSWDARTGEFEQMWMSAKSTESITAFDEKLSSQLQSGKTDVTQALNLLGTPSTLTIKGSRQELHYNYTSHILRLFFRDNILVDFTLIGQRRTQ